MSRRFLDLKRLRRALDSIDMFGADAPPGQLDGLAVELWAARNRELIGEDGLIRVAQSWFAREMELPITDLALSKLRAIIEELCRGDG